MSSVSSWQSCPLERLLAERFHITTGFYPGQREIIELLLQGKRVLAIQRTGWGKSLCYQAASLYLPHLTFVFSPLKALMRDQCQRCNNAYAIPAAIVSSEFSEEENHVTLEQAVAGTFKILFIAPERLHNALWQAYVQKMRISMVVIDEAHCISTWGHDFRPDYRRIVRFVSALPSTVPVLALTATANQRVEQDILQQIGVVQVLRGSMQRPNLYLNVEQLKGDREKLSYLAEILPYYPGTGIIYTATKHHAEMVATFLRHRGMATEYYHSGKEDDERQDIERNFMSNAYKVVSSTNALGMGIDKPDIRFVIHYQLPASPIHYYQEIGRAGRDGKASWCTLLFDPSDLVIQERFIRDAKPEAKYYESVLSCLLQNRQGLKEVELLQNTGLSQTMARTILADLEEQTIIERIAQTRTYIAASQLRHIDFSLYDEVRQQKQHELQNMQDYVHTSTCYMQHLSAYLGDHPHGPCRACARCRKSNFPLVKPTQRIQTAAAYFLAEVYMPRIDKRGTGKNQAHEAGWSLSYHGNSRTGMLIRVSKYKEGGPFALELVLRAVELIQTRYPIQSINGIVSVPPTRSGTLVELYTRKIADMLGIPYISALVKVRQTREQKCFTNRVQKAANVKDSFHVPYPEQVSGCALLVIDDIYDSGWTMREVGQTLMKAGAQVVYPFTITRTVHTDDQ